MEKIRIFLRTINGKIFITFLITSILFLALFLPLYYFTSPNIDYSAGAAENKIVAYNRDSSSGTRVSFINTVLDLDPDEIVFGKQERESSSNGVMASQVENTPNSIGYVSGSGFSWDDSGNPIVENPNTKIMSFYNETNNQAFFPNKQNVQANNYTPIRNFNIFWRKNPKLTRYYWDNTTNSFGDTNDLWTNESALIENDSIVYAFMFLNWVLFSESAHEIMEEHGLFTISGQPSVSSAIMNPVIEQFFTSANNISQVDYCNYTIWSSVGSLSVSSIAKLLWEGFHSEFQGFISSNCGTPWDGTNAKFGFTGSSAAFTPESDLPGSPNPILGYQSKDDPSSAIEFYQANVPGDYTNEDAEKGYKAFSIDILVLIANKNGTKFSVGNSEGDDLSGVEIEVDAISKHSARQIYLNEGIDWKSVYLMDKEIYS